MDGIFKKKAKNVIKGGFLIYGGLGVSLAQLSASMTEGQIENYGQVQKQKSQSENIQAVIELLNQEKPDEDEIVQLIEEFMETYCYEQELRIQYATELLQRIVVYGHPDIIEFLIEAGAEINGQNQFKQTALHLATLHHQTGVVSLLLRHIDINPNIQDRFGRTPLHWAVLFQWFDITFLLLQFPSIDVNLRDISRQTPLHLAASNGDYTNAFLLCQHIFTVIDARDVNRQTPLYHAIQHGHGDVVDLLTRKGASLDCRDSWGRTPFHTAAASGHLDIIKLEHYDGQQDRSDNFGRTPLHLASIQEDLEGIQYMFQESPLHAIDINRTDQQGNTPLHSAAGARDLNIMKMLIDYGADICAKNNRQQTPWNVLHKANDPHSAEFACIADFFRTRRNSPTNVSPTKRLIALLYWWMLHFDDVDDLVVAEKITGLIRLGINIGERDYDHQRTLREVIQRILPRRLLKKFKRIVRQLWEQQLLTKKQKALFKLLLSVRFHRYDDHEFVNTVKLIELLDRWKARANLSDSAEIEAGIIALIEAGINVHMGRNNRLLWEVLEQLPVRWLQCLWEMIDQWRQQQQILTKKQWALFNFVSMILQNYPQHLTATEQFINLLYDWSKEGSLYTETIIEQLPRLIEEGIEPDTINSDGQTLSEVISEMQFTNPEFLEKFQNALEYTNTFQLPTKSPGRRTAKALLDCIANADLKI